MNADFSNGVSVIICCYNSAPRLQQTLAHLALQEVDKNIPWELIIVDNNSSDNTAQFAKDEWTNLAVNTPFKIVEEPKAGLSYARERGATAASYDILIFCDDDNWLEKKYIQTAFDVMQSNKKIGIAAGQSTGAFESAKPEWFDRFGQAYAIGLPFKESGIANERKYLAGAGMITRKSILEKLKSYNYAPVISDRTATNLISGGDAELCLAVIYMGYDLYYDERLQFIHFITTPRLQWSYCVQMMSRGHAIPQLYLFLYSYSENCYNKNEIPEFKNAYKAIKKNISRKSVKSLFFAKPFWLPFLTLIKMQEGSRKEIYLKANLRKLSHLLLRKKDLQIAFEKINIFLVNVHPITSTGKPIKQNDYTNLRLHES